MSAYTQTTNLAPVALSNDYYSLDNLPSVNVPTVVSAFTNDSGYITSNQAKSALSVTSASAGTPSLTYNSTTGAFTYTPPDLSVYATIATTITLANLKSVVAASTDFADFQSRIAAL